MFSARVRSFSTTTPARAWFSPRKGKPKTRPRYKPGEPRPLLKEDGPSRRKLVNHGPGPERGGEALELRAPIPPTVKNLEVRDNHPLWQFFHDKQYARMPDDLSDMGESWTIPQLRRKAFEDLHTLWYVCVKERNRLLRETRVIEHALGRRQVEENTSRIPSYQEALDKIKTTMWRIRHVLAERHHAHINGMNAFYENYDEIVAEFEAEYLAGTDAEDAAMESMLERFQYAYFGINPMLEENFPAPNVARGLKLVANLKLKRFGPSAGADDVTAVNDIREAFVVFMAEHTPEGIADALQSVRQYRQASPAPIKPHQEVEVLAQLMFNLEKEKSATPEPEPSV